MEASSQLATPRLATMATNASAAGSRRVLRAFLPRASAGIVAVDDVPNAPCRAPV